MSRPFKCRCISCEPGINYFKPRGIPLTELQEVVLTVDEFEAVRLADLEWLYQEAAAQKMKISRQTFGNIIRGAHGKVADAIINGKAIKIEGGVYTKAEKRTFICEKCSHAWELGYGTGRPRECPKCKCCNIHRAAPDKGPVTAGDCCHGKKERQRRSK
jgi:predicted DNA-binding protein (UPF0251 family)